MSTVMPSSTLPPYPAYKPSGAPWLGDIPEHWEMPRLRGYVTNAIDLTRAPADGEFYLALEHVESWTGWFSEAGNGVSISGQVKRFRAEDVLFGKLRPYLAKVACPKRNGVCVGEFLVLRPHDAGLSPRYLEQLLRSKPIIDVVDASTFGAKMPRADWQFIGDLLFPLPALPEQCAIVRYLRYVDRRIRRYVSAKRRLIALLEEEKQAIVNQAVTRGLDPSVRLKPSGVEWLGDVPEHWEVLPNRGVLKLKKEAVGSRSDEYALLSLTKQGIIPRNAEIAKGKFPASFNTYQVVFPGDLIFCLFDIDETPRTVGISSKEGMVTGAYTRFVCVDESTARFVYLLYRSLDDRKALKPLYSGLRKSIATQIFLSAKLALPPAYERTTIVEHVEKATADIDAAISRARRQIELVQEYRTRLIADVVTGKVDVREAAALQPEEADEPEPIDEDGLVPDNGDSDFHDASEPEEDPENEMSA